MSLQKIILERNKEFEEGHNTDNISDPASDTEWVKAFNHDSNILLIEEVIRELEEIKAVSVEGNDTEDYKLGLHRGWNKALEYQISSLTKSLEEIKNLA